MLHNKPCEECDSCYKKEEIGTISPRLRANKKWSDIQKTALSKTVEDFSPLYLDLRLNNICNLKCRMCSDYFSSSIAQENKKLYGIDSVIPTLNLTERQNTIVQLYNFLDGVEEIYFAGGEPLITEEHYLLLDYLLSRDRTDVKLFYNSNFTNLTYKKHSVLDYWQKFNRVSVGCSLDAEGKTAEYMRYGTVWKDILDNIQQTKTQCPHVTISVASVAGALNIKSLIKLQQDWIDSKLIPASEFIVRPIISPDHQTSLILPLDEKQKLKKLIVAHQDFCKTCGANQLVDHWQTVLDYMLSQDHSYILPKTKRILAEQDSARGIYINEYIPSFANILDNIQEIN